MKALALTFFLLAAATFVTAASARPNPKRQVIVLQHRLHNMAVSRDAFRAQFAASQTQIGVLQTQNANLVSERNMALASVASLQTQIASVPTPLTVAIEQVGREVAYQEHEGFLTYSHGRLVSQAALDYVVGHVSASVYGYETDFGLPYPTALPNAILGLQAGICGHAALTFAAIVKSFGLSVRSVQFYYTDPNSPAGLGKPDSHIADEVYYDGDWHFYDPTFGNFWQDNQNVVSIINARAGTGTEVKDETGFTNLAENFLYGDSTWFETDAATVVAIDQQPFN